MVDKGIPIRLVIYGVAFVYIFIDLVIVGGPLRQALFRKNLNKSSLQNGPILCHCTIECHW